MTAMTVAMTEAYFRAPPKTDVLRTGLYDFVLACPVGASPWEWNAGFGLLIHKHTGAAKPRTGFPPRASAEPYYQAQTINAEVRVAEYNRDWRDSDVAPMAPTVVDTKPVPKAPIYDEHLVDRIMDRMRDPKVWHEVQAPLKRGEQKKRAKGFHPSMRNVTPRDHMTDEDREHFIAQARELMANFCHLTHALPQCKILASKLTFRLLEAIEWEMINTAEWGRGLTTKIDDALRSAGAPHGPQRADGSDDLSVERWEQQREGARFQYHWMQLIFRAWSDQMVDTFTEYGGFMQGTQHNSNARQGIEHTGHTWEYVPVLLRQKQKKERARNVEKLSAVHRAMLIGKPPEEFEAYYAKYTGFKPRKGGSVHDKATPHVAQPMSENEATWMDEEGHHAGYTFDDDGNVVD